MKVGCFALIDPFETLDHQLERISELGFKYTDITDNHPGGLLGQEFGFSATVSLDDNPIDIKNQFESHGLKITSVCAHANLLDPSSPARYATEEIMKAIRMASEIGVEHVITTEGEPKSEWGENLSRNEQLFIIEEKLKEPVRLAEALDVKVLIETHGELTDSIDGMEAILERLGHPKTVGVTVDTGNVWLSGNDPVEFVEVFRDRIGHVHWKDLPSGWREKRGEIYGCGMSPIPLGEGVIDIRKIAEIAQEAPKLEFTTLEVAGDENLQTSFDYLSSYGAERV